jgi:hypothetical protein
LVNFCPLPQSHYPQSHVRLLGAVYQASKFTDAPARCLDAKEASSREPAASCNSLATHPDPESTPKYPRGVDSGTTLHSCIPSLLRLLRLAGVTVRSRLSPPLEARSLLPFSAHAIPATAECGTLAFGDRLTYPASAGLVECPRLPDPAPRPDLECAAAAVARSSGCALPRRRVELQGPGVVRRRIWQRRRLPLRRAGSGWRGCPRTTSRGWCSRSPPASSSGPASSSRRRGLRRPVRPASAQVTCCVSPLSIPIDHVCCSVDRGGLAVCCCVFALIFEALPERAEGWPRGSVFDSAWNLLSR